MKQHLLVAWLVCAAAHSTPLHSVSGISTGASLAVQSIPRHSVSGFSSGASLAVVHTVAFSGSVEGTGLIGASPYGCQTLPDAADTCSGMNSDGVTFNASIPWQTYLNTCHIYMQTHANRDQIDPLSNLQGTPVFLFSGTRDSVVFQPVMHAVATQFANLSAKVKTEFGLAAEHAWILDDEQCPHPGAADTAHCCGPKGSTTHCPLLTNISTVIPCCGQCSSGAGGKGGPWWTPPINSCNFDLSGNILRWIYGPDLTRGEPLRHNLITVGQSDLLPEGWTAEKAAVDPIGFVYIPRNCQSSSPKQNYVAHLKRNSYLKFGSLDIDETPMSGLSLQQCQQKCDSAAQCMCVVYKSATKQCWRRAACVPEQFAKMSSYDTYVKKPPRIASHCHRFHIHYHA